MKLPVVSDIRVNSRFGWMALTQLFIGLFLVGLLATSDLRAQSGDRGNPESENVYKLSWWGVMWGPPIQCVNPDKTEEFATEVFPLGDVDHDGLADWAVSRVRCDTEIVSDGFPEAPTEIFVYHGKRRGLPDASSGERIGPSEIGSWTRLLTSGDFDGDSNTDLVTQIRIFNDSSFPVRDYYILRTVIFWGNSQGHLSIQDTTQLDCGADSWQGSLAAVSILNENGADDLIIKTRDGGILNGDLIALPALYIYRGHLRERWGRSGVSRFPDWQWWKAPPFGELVTVDQDCDGLLDVALIDDDGVTATVTVLYGRAGALPDTTEAETVSLKQANGHSTIFIDLTGDGVPELATNCGSQEQVRIYAGKPGQRLLEQYGTGADPADPLHGRDYARPWVTLWLPPKIHDGWPSAGFSRLHDLGDIGSDGIHDLCVPAFRILMFYNGGFLLDSLIDADLEPPTGQIRYIANVGDIDGSGRSSIALSLDNGQGGIAFLKRSDSVPNSGYEQYRLPHPLHFRCEHAAGIVENPSPRPAQKRSLLQLRIDPNPTEGTLHMRWRAEGLRGTGIITISDGSGKERARWTVPSDAGVADFPLRRWIAGRYFLTIRIGNLSETQQIEIP